MTIQFTNNASTTLASGITAIATSLTVATGAGALFPTPSGAAFFYCTLQNVAGTLREIVKVTARTTDTFTIVRAQDGTSGQIFSTSDKVELRVTAADLNNFGQLDTGNTWATGQTFVAPVLGTPASGTLTNCTFPTLNQNTSGTAAGLSATLAVGSGGTGQTSLASVTVGNATVSGSTTGNAATVTTVTQANIAGAVAPSTSGNVLTSNGTAWTSTALPAGGVTSIVAGTGITISGGTGAVTVTNAGLGIGQTYTNVLASRIVSTTYTNSTGKPILLQIVINGASTNSVIINSVTVFTWSTSTSAGMFYSGIVQNGQTYSYTGSALFSFWELR